MSNDPLSLNKHELVILDLLATPPRRGWYGSDLVAHSEGALSRLSVYSHLENLAQMELIREEDDPPVAGRVPRTRHFITDQGLRQLRLAPKAPPTPWFGGLAPSPQ